MIRIYHSWDKWECYPSGFWNSYCPDGMKTEEGINAFSNFLSDINKFEDALKGIILNWPYSCEHNLTNESMNRIAWLGQASVAYSIGIPSYCRSGYTKMTDTQKKAADKMALKYLNIWLKKEGYDQLDGETVKQKTKQPKF